MPRHTLLPSPEYPLPTPLALHPGKPTPPSHPATLRLPCPSLEDSDPSNPSAPPSSCPEPRLSPSYPSNTAPPSRPSIPRAHSEQKRAVMTGHPLPPNWPRLRTRRSSLFSVRERGRRACRLESWCSRVKSGMRGMGGVWGIGGGRRSGGRGGRRGGYWDRVRVRDRE